MACSLCKAFYLDSTDIRIKILIVVDIVFLITPQKYLHGRSRLNKENKSSYFDIFVQIRQKEMIRNRLSWWQGYLFRKFIKLCWKPHFCTLAISRLIKGQHTTNTQQSIKMRTEYVTKNQKSMSVTWNEIKNIL